MDPAIHSGLASGETDRGHPACGGRLPLGLPCQRVRMWRSSSAALPTLWWLGTTPALGLDAREPGGAGGDPRSPGSPRPARRQTLLARPREVSAGLPGSRRPARRRRRRGGAAQDGTGQPRCLTAHSTPITASMTTQTTTLPAAPTRRSGSRGRRTGDPGGG